MLFLNKNEEKIIKTFMLNQADLEDAVMVLKWADGSRVVAKYDYILEDENEYEIEDENYEEFWSFAFKALRVSGTPPICITQHNYFLISYRNFPDEIIADGQKVN